MRCLRNSGHDGCLKKSFRYSKLVLEKRNKYFRISFEIKNKYDMFEKLKFHKYMYLISIEGIYILLKFGIF